MAWEFGIGKRKVYYLNCDGAELINGIFERFARYYQMALNLGDRKISKLYSKNRIVLIEDRRDYRHDGVFIGFSCKKPGIFVNGKAYSGQIANMISSETGIKIFEQSNFQKNLYEPDVTVDLGKRMSEAEAFCLMRYSLLQLPLSI